MRISSVLQNVNGDQTDFIFVTVPWTETKMPLMAPAALKPVVEKAGLSCLAVDYNAEIQKFVKSTDDPGDYINFFYNEKVNNPDTAKVLHQLLEELAHDLISWKPKYIALSLLTYVSQHFAKWLSFYIKKLNPNVKIIAGGAGCLDTFVGDSDYIKFSLEHKLVDYHIRGDGEHSLFELLSGNNKFPGINDSSWQEMNKDDLSKVPIPNYDDYNFDFYSLPSLPIIGSRGCVRRCKFCDYIENWKTFQWRDHQDVFDEMVLQAEKHGITNFKFQDSLTNGNMNEFTKLLELITDYNNKNPDKKLSWSGHYVFRNVNDRSDYEWEMVAKSGARFLNVGIENLNQDIRYHIGKKFDNESIIYHLEKALEHNVMIVMLNIVGYVFEEQHHIDYIKQWLHDNTRFASILRIQWGGGLGIFPHTYLDRNKDKLGVEMIGSKLPFEWVNRSVDSTPKKRAKWIRELMQTSKDLGYTVVDNLDNHYLVEKLLNGDY